MCNSEYFVPENRQMTQPVGNRRPLSAALGSSDSIIQMPDDLVTFPRCTSPSKSIIHCQRSPRFPQWKKTHCYTIISQLYSFTPINNVFLPRSRGVGAMLSSDQICAVLIGRSYFDQSVTYKCFETFRAFQAFVWYIRKPFPPRGWKYSLFGGRCESQKKGNFMREITISASDRWWLLVKHSSNPACFNFARILEIRPVAY